MGEIAINMTWLVGQNENCAIQVDDPDVSGVHCQVDRTEDGRYLVTDLGSEHGTRIRSRRGHLRPAHRHEEILPGEVLVIGRSEIRWAQTPEFIFNRANPTSVVEEL